MEALIGDAVAAHFGGVQRRMALEIDMDPASFSRAVREASFNTENCLRIAKVTGIPAVLILRLTGKTDIADILEGLFGRDQRSVSELDRRVLALPDKFKQNMLDAHASAQAKESPPLGRAVGKRRTG